MARSCLACQHPLRTEIDAYLTATNRYTGGLRQLAKRYGLSLNGLSRHQRHHLREGPAEEALAPPAEVREVLPGISLVHAPAEGYLPTLEPGSVHSVVTSPPYLWKRRNSPEDEPDPDELGQEESPEQYVARLVAILRPLKQALRRDGVMLLNIGDGHYNVYGGGSKTMTTGNARHVKAMGRHTPPKHPRLQRKSLIRVHSLLMDALEVDGWLIRDLLIWHKPNGVPHPGLHDRATTNHEYVLHLTLGPAYFWNAAAIAEPAAWERWGAQTLPKAKTNGATTGASGASFKERTLEEIRRDLARPTKNRRSVLSFKVSTYRGKHSAVMPVDLAELLVAASTPPGGLCLDPFAGAGTTAVACLRLGEDRRFLGIEKEAPNVAEATDRLRTESARLASEQAERARRPVTPPLPSVPGGFQLAVVDPPWTFATRSPKGQGKSPGQHYATMTLDELMALPLPAVMARDSELALWTTGPHLFQARDLLEAWGYRYSTVLLDWEKVTATGKPAVTHGFATLPNHEYLLRARRGKGLPRRARDVRQDLKAAVGAHSEKPAESYARLERFYGPDVRRLDAFSRTNRPGWTAWGLEAGKLNATPRTLPLPLESDSDAAG